MSIRFKIIAISVLILFVSMGINMLVTTKYFAEEYTSARKDEVFVITNTLKSQLDRLLKMHIPLTQLVGFEVLCQDAVHQHSIISYAMVVDVHGKILFHNDPSNHHKIISNESVLTILDGAQKNVSETKMGDAEFYDFFIPVQDSREEVIAYIRTGFPRSHIQNKTRRLAVYSIGVTSILFSIGCLFLISLLYHWVSRPISQFTNTIEEIRKYWSPEDSRTVDVSTHDEIGQLARAFNQMTDDLRLTTVSKDYVDNILKNMLNSLIITDENFMILTVNHETLNLLGYNEEQLVGKSIFDILDKSENPNEKAGPLTGETNTIRAIETNYISQNGEKIPLLLSFSRLKGRHEADRKGYICVGQDMTEIKTLRGFIPICSSCKKIRDDKGYWNQVEKYISDHSKASFSHSICPDCLTELYPNFKADTLEANKSKH